MVVHVPQPGIPPDARAGVGWGMEQFHHPHPVRCGGVVTAQRRELIAGLSGRVLEVGAGDGVKLTCYPAACEEIVLVEPDPFLRAAARLVAGGELRFHEHQRSANPAVALAEMALTPVWARVCGVVIPPATWSPPSNGPDS
ncbi:hypothetical protein [Nonomuraea insulae]|uniref:Uncharacterized protein n=1 Tax=Nonomuraea insulae TaxID=1616787 RepID=A0ABW1CJP2_9ACTN